MTSYMHEDIAAARREDLLAQACAARLAHAARGERGLGSRLRRARRSNPTGPVATSATVTANSTAL